MALTKPERIRYKASRKLSRYILCLLRIKAVENVIGEYTIISRDLINNALLGIEKLIAESVPSSQASSPLSQQRVISQRSMSAVPQSCHTKTKPLTPANSIGERKSIQWRCEQSTLPVHTLRESLKFINATHNLVRMVSVIDISSQLSLVLEKARQLLKNSFLNDEEEWTLHSFCFKCGRSGHLMRCSGCDTVSFCSQLCKDDCWRSGHRLECTTAHVHNQQTTSKVHTTSAKALSTKSGENTLVCDSWLPLFYNNCRSEKDSFSISF